MVAHIVAYTWLFGTGLMLLRVLTFSARDFMRQTGLARGRSELPSSLKYIFPHYPLDNGCIEFSLSVKVFVAFVNLIFNLAIGIIVAFLYPIYFIIAIFWVADNLYLYIRRRMKARERPANLDFVALMLFTVPTKNGKSNATLYEQIIQRGEIMNSEELHGIYRTIISNINPESVPASLKHDYELILKSFETNQSKENQWPFVVSIEKSN